MYLIQRQLVPLPTGTPVVLDGRDSRLPQYFRFDNHPLLSHVDGVRHVYVYLQDTRSAAMAEFYKFVKEQKFPNGTKTALENAGMFYYTTYCSHLMLCRVFVVTSWRLCLRA